MRRVASVPVPFVYRSVSGAVREPEFVVSGFDFFVRCNVYLLWVHAAMWALVLFELPLRIDRDCDDRCWYLGRVD